MIRPYDSGEPFFAAFCFSTTVLFSVNALSSFATSSDPLIPAPNLGRWLASPPLSHRVPSHLFYSNLSSHPLLSFLLVPTLPTSSAPVYGSSQSLWLFNLFNGYEIFQPWSATFGTHSLRSPVSNVWTFCLGTFESTAGPIVIRFHLVKDVPPVLFFVITLAPVGLRSVLIPSSDLSSLHSRFPTAVS